MKQISEQKSSKLWTTYYFIVIVFNLFISMSHYMIISTLPIYVKTIGGDNSSAGLLMGAFTIAALAFRPVFGKYLDSRGRRAVLLIGCTLFLAGTILQSFASSVTVLVLLRIVQGIGFSANSTAGGTVVADLVPADRLSEGIGYYGISMTLATAAGPAIALYLIRDHNFQPLFLMTSFIIFGALLLAVFLKYERRIDRLAIRSNVKEKRREKRTSKQQRISKKLKYGSVIEKKAAVHASVIFFAALGYSSILTFLPVYGESKGIVNISLFYTVYAGAILLTRLCTGKLADRIGITPVILPAMAMMLVSFILLAYTGTLSVLLIAAVLFGLGFGTVSPLLNTLILKAYPPEKRGAANAVYYSAMDIGIAAGSIIWGIVSQNYGLYSIYLGSAAAVVVSLVTHVYFNNSNISAVKILVNTEETAA